MLANKDMLNLLNSINTLKKIIWRSMEKGLLNFGNIPSHIFLKRLKKTTQLPLTIEVLQN